ncbi:UDP-N-acetyl-D-mannosamine dehydrogenase [Arthrobacter mobilis]|uniref:UDP-N-acetyl-D-mannosamine dehydrogenase n=1 Tax=Arthrobacter mobilis TaxID=2724944 RepID=A0A7X6HDW8_9MICC|nr:UDP-N-acetyl-D-mannosamine dehydrogenase [Arthrobacter mobilis]NKX55362.1 UDP-N-acetyl-D-mannosamine dehydrogenase [Arthrobacter mobilis]
MGKTTFDLAVIGLGYIGLPTAATFASHGKKVAGVDVKQSTVDAVNRGEVPFVEPDLGVVVSGTVSLGSLKAFTEVPQADAFIIAVPTPVAEDKDVDLSYLRSAAEMIAPVLRGGELVILESTSPPGTTERIGEFLVAARPDLCLLPEPGKRQIHLAHSPERVLPGRIMIEIVTNDRVVGGLTPEASRMAKELYEVICQGEIHVTDAKTAEMTKLAENSFRDLNIAFANQLALMCGQLGVDVWRLIELANRHPRVDILKPGPGVGGHCIAVDPWFLVSAFPNHSGLARAARELNDSMPGHVVDRALAAVADVPAPTIALLGLAFKANVDDTRESPAMDVVRLLADAAPGATLLAVDPHVPALPQALAGAGNIGLAELDTALEAADLVVLLVDHDEFKALDQDRLLGRRIIDTRGVWRPADGADGSLAAAAVPSLAL